MLETDLFPPLKKYFNNLGFKVFPEISLSLGERCSVDFVAVKSSIQIAVEMKLFFNDKLIEQAIYNQNRYDNPRSMARAIKQWSKFDIKKFKKVTKNLDYIPRYPRGVYLFSAD